jgi:hypothetical protein
MGMGDWHSPTFPLIWCPVLIMMWFEQAAAAVSAFLRVHWAAVPQAQCVHGACTGGGGSDYDALMRRRACHLLATAPQSCCNRVHGACAGGGGSAERTHAAVGKRLEAAEASDSSAEGGALCWVVELAHRGDAVRLIMIGCTIRTADGLSGTVGEPQSRAIVVSLIWWWWQVRLSVRDPPPPSLLAGGGTAPAAAAPAVRY